MNQGMLARLEALEGQLEQAHEAVDLQRFAQYRDRPGQLALELGIVDRWTPDQQKLFDAIAAGERRIVVRGANGTGKDVSAGRGLVPWACLAREAFVLLTAPTARQAHEIMMAEVRRAFVKGGLPGELLERAWRVDRIKPVGALAVVSNDVSSLTGFHAPMVVGIVSEAQGASPESFEGLMSCATGESDIVVLLGNPLVASGRFYDCSRSGYWHGITMPATTHPNVLEQREVIPGAVTQQFIDTMRTEYGEGSGVYQARVLAQFPDSNDDALIRRSWCERAVTAGKVASSWSVPPRPVIAVDPARFGSDLTALATRRADRFGALEMWGKADLMTSTGRVIDAVQALGYGPADVDIVVDEVGVGGGLCDRLREQGWRTTAYNGGSAAQEPRFLNLRAESYWQFARALEDGLVALPDDDRLVDELTAVRWRPTSSGKIQLEAKDDLRQRLGRSPDRADAVVMAWWGGAHRSAIDAAIVAARMNAALVSENPGAADLIGPFDRYKPWWS